MCHSERSGAQRNAVEESRECSEEHRRAFTGILRLRCAPLRMTARRNGWCAIRAALVLIAVAWIGLKFVPLPSALLKSPVQSLELTDRNGVPLRETRVDERFARAV